MVTRPKQDLHRTGQTAGSMTPRAASRQLVAWSCLSLTSQGWLQRQQRSLPHSMHHAALGQPAVQLWTRDQTPLFVRQSIPFPHLCLIHLAARWQKQQQILCSQQQSLPGHSRLMACQRIVRQQHLQRLAGIGIA